RRGAGAGPGWMGRSLATANTPAAASRTARTMNREKRFGVANGFSFRPDGGFQDGTRPVNHAPTLTKSTPQPGHFRERPQHRLRGGDVKVQRVVGGKGDGVHTGLTPTAAGGSHALLRRRGSV